MWVSGASCTFVYTSPRERCSCVCVDVLSCLFYFVCVGGGCCWLLSQGTTVMVLASSCVCFRGGLKAGVLCQSIWNELFNISALVNTHWDAQNILTLCSLHFLTGMRMKYWYNKCQTTCQGLSGWDTAMKKWMQHLKEVWVQENTRCMLRNITPNTTINIGWCCWWSADTFSSHRPQRASFVTTSDTLTHLRHIRLHFVLPHTLCSIYKTYQYSCLTWRASHFIATLT